MRTCIQIVIVVITIVVAARCQSSDGNNGSPEPDPGRFSRKYIVAQTILEGTDALFTQQAACRYDWKRCDYRYAAEYNPIARPLVREGRKGIAIYFSGELAVKLTAAYIAHRKRSRLEKWIETAGLVGSASGTAMGVRNFATDKR